VIGKLDLQRKGNFDVFNMQKGGVIKLVGGWSAGAEDKVAEYYYPGGLTKAPRDGIVPEESADFVAADDSSGILALALGIIGLASVGVVTIAFFYYRRHPIIKPTSVNLGYIQIACIVLGFVQLLVMVGKPTSSICAVDLFLIPIAFSMYYSIALVKNYRIYLVFNFSGLQIRKMTDYYLALYAALFTFPNIIAIVALSAISPPLPKAVMTGVLTYEWTCASVDAFSQFVAVRFMIIYNALLLLLNLFVAFKNRSVNSTFNETKMIAVSMYNVSMIVIFCVPILYTTSLGFRTRHLIKVICVFYVTMFNLVASFALKSYQAFTDKRVAGSSNNSKNTSQMNHKETEHSTLEGKHATMVAIKKSDLFAQAKPRFMLAESKNSVIFYETFRTSLEDKEIKSSCFGEIWTITNCQVFTR
jgi:hypothetical protein